MYNNVKTLLFETLTFLLRCVFLLKWYILAVSAEVEVYNFQITFKKSFITSTTEIKYETESVCWRNCKMQFFYF